VVDELRVHELLTGTETTADAAVGSVTGILRSTLEILSVRVAGRVASKPITAGPEKVDPVIAGRPRGRQEFP
jgi:hypothetical protein